MATMHLNRISGTILTGLSVLALGTVLVGIAVTPKPLPADEGTLAHIFQLSIAATVPAGLVFLATADWRAPQKAVRTLALSGGVVIAAFAALYYLEHIR
jgi:hypothetical protein